MNKYKIWMEGFCMSGEGEQGNAHFVGEEEANSFREACDIFYSKQHTGISREYNSEYLSYWGCRLFDNEIEARNMFG